MDERRRGGRCWDGVVCALGWVLVVMMGRSRCGVQLRWDELKKLTARRPEPIAGQVKR